MFFIKLLPNGIEVFTRGERRPPLAGERDVRSAFGFMAALSACLTGMASMQAEQLQKSRRAAGFKADRSCVR